MTYFKRWLSALALGLGLAAPTAQAVEVLFAHVMATGHPYHANGNTIASWVGSLGGYNVTIRDLDTAVYNDYDQFDQIWVYDLYTGSNNNATQAANYAAIGDWYNNLGNNQKNLIADGRIISSPWAGPGSEQVWIQNYAQKLQSNGRTGGLVLGTDHQAYVDGINEINAAIGIDLFYGTLGTSVAVVDQNSPLYRVDGTFACGNNQRCIRDNSSPGYAPTDMQANGQTLTPVAYHGTVNEAWDNAAVSSTIGSRTFGTCGNPGQPPCETPTPGSLPLLFLGMAIALQARRRRH